MLVDSMSGFLFPLASLYTLSKLAGIVVLPKLPLFYAPIGVTNAAECLVGYAAPIATLLLAVRPPAAAARIGAAGSAASGVTGSAAGGSEHAAIVAIRCVGSLQVIARHQGVSSRTNVCHTANHRLQRPRVLGTTVTCGTRVAYVSTVDVRVNWGCRRGRGRTHPRGKRRIIALARKQSPL